MSPSLVKWIPHSIAFSFQDWFMPERDLRPGRASIAARGASQPERTASPHFVWVFYVILLTPSFALCCSPRFSDERNVRMPRDVTRRTLRIISDLFDTGFYRVPRHVDEIDYAFFNISVFYAQWERKCTILIIFEKTKYSMLTSAKMLEEKLH